MRDHKDEADHGITTDSKRPWQATFWRRDPIFGIAALATGLLAGLAAIAILVASDDVPLEQWQIYGHRVQPTVILAVLSTLTNILLYYAFAIGITINWWTSAWKGTTLEKLHRCWDFGHSTTSIFLNPRHLFSRAAIASLFTILLLADGPLLQRASNVAIVTRHEMKNFTMPISPRYLNPPYFSSKHRANYQ
jgi:hypothetical protein